MARRGRKQHLQQSFRYRDKNGQHRGGKRKRAGRPPSGWRAGESHARRASFRASEPLHVVLRVTTAVGRLRRRKMYAAVRWAMYTAFRREDFRIVHLSIQDNHIHMLVEANDRHALARGMQGFQIAAAKHINAALADELGARRRGRVFADRYHAEIITSPRRARHCLAYVLNNWRRHHMDRAGIARSWKVDPFSSGDSFDGWSELEASPTLWRTPPTYKPLPVWRPKTWLLRVGWRRHGLVGAFEVPGPRASVTAPVLAD